MFCNFSIFGLIRHAAGLKITRQQVCSLAVSATLGLLRLPNKRVSCYVSQHDLPALVVPPATTCRRRQAAVQQAADCINSISDFVNDNDDAVGVSE